VSTFASDTPQLFTAVKLAPGRCPACLHPFRTPQDLASTYPGAHRPVPIAPFETARLFPELWTHEEHDGEVISMGQRLPGGDVGFVACVRCQNVTLQMVLDERTYTTREEADRLCEREGFHVVRSSLIGGADPGTILRLVREREAQARERRGLDEVR
jgi:hypothetical protein